MNEFDAKAGSWDDDPERWKRTQAVAEAIGREVPLDPGMRALEYGCGTGQLSFALRSNLGPILLADSSVGMLAVLEEKIAKLDAAQQMKPLRLDLEAGLPEGLTVQIVYSLMVLHHIPDTSRILRAFHSLLEPGGFLCLSDLDVEDGSFHGPGAQVHPGFDRAALRAQLEAAGFTDVRIDTCHSLVRHGRNYSLFLAVAEKPLKPVRRAELDGRGEEGRIDAPAQPPQLEIQVSR